MRLCHRCAWMCSIVLMLGLFGFDGVSVNAFADDVVLISTTILPAGQIGIPYSAPVVAGDGAPPFHWYLISGNLPGGLALDAGTGAISGTPNSTGAFSFTAGITDAEGKHAIGYYGREHKTLERQHEALGSPGTVEAQARRLGMMKQGERPYIVSGLPNN